MKKKNKYKLINHAFKEYGEIWNRKYERKTYSKKYLLELMKEYHHSGMTEWWYCCRGLYQCCWQDPFEEGIWGFSQKRVDEIIINIISRLDNRFFREERIGICQTKNEIHVIIIARDLRDHKCDYLMTFTD